MADTSQSWGKEHSSAVIDLSDTEMEVAGSDTSDYETNFSDSKSQAAGSKKADGAYMDTMKQRLQENVTNMMWQSGKEKAKSAWNVYGNIDFLRPYFNVEPHEVRTRLLLSLLPQRPTDQRQRIPRELYGPMMVIFTLIALLLFQMKTAEHRVEEGTLMGTAFGVCFTYWLGASGFIWFLSYVCNAHLALIQILSMMVTGFDISCTLSQLETVCMKCQILLAGKTKKVSSNILSADIIQKVVKGYGLFSHCIVLFLGTVIHTSHDHLFFYLLWAIVGGLSALRMVSIVLSRTHGQTQRLIVCGAIAALHLLFLLYLHFAYHQIVEDLSRVFESHNDPVPVEQKDTPQPGDGIGQAAEKRWIVCENNGTMTISCTERPGTTLHILYANYGRTSADFCKHPVFDSKDTTCVGSNSMAVVQGLCQHKTSCTLAAENRVFGDPCVGNYKYLEVQFECRDSG